MGRDKALLPWPPAGPGQAASTETFLSAAIRSLSPYNDMVFVVAGRNEANISPVVYSNGAFVVTNPDPSRGQFSSLQVGLREVLSRGRDAAMITLVDRPPLPTATIEGSTRLFYQRYPAMEMGGDPRVQRETWASDCRRARIDGGFPEGG